MNYKYLIALFGGEELDAWTPPKSEWILASDGHDGRWTESFKALMEKNGEDVFYGANLYPALHISIKNYRPQDNVLIYSIEKRNLKSDGGCGFAGSDIGTAYYYNEDKNWLMTIPKSVGLLTDEQIINFIDSATPEQLSVTGKAHEEKLT